MTSKVQEFQFHEVEHLSKWETFQKAVYDPDKREFCGRTKKSWYQLLIFYTIFYACLAALFAICMQGLIATLDDKQPSYILADSLIGTNPGLGFRPMSDDTQEGSLIWYNLNEIETASKWVNLIDQFLEPYRAEQLGKNYQECDSTTPPQEGHVCTVKLDQFGPCSSENRYGYNSSSPCVFLKLNKIFGWVPQYYTEPEKNMPDDIKTLIDVKNSTGVWISCYGEKPTDRERIAGFRYFPSQDFPGYYFPYQNYENYLSPLIAVQVLHVEPTVIVNIECRAWAKNIRYSGSEKNREGSVHFEVLVDNS